VVERFVFVDVDVNAVSLLFVSDESDAALLIFATRLVSRLLTLLRARLLTLLPLLLLLSDSTLSA